MEALSDLNRKILCQKITPGTAEDLESTVTPINSNRLISEPRIIRTKIQKCFLSPQCKKNRNKQTRGFLTPHNSKEIPQNCKCELSEDHCFIYLLQLKNAPCRNCENGSESFIPISSVYPTSLLGEQHHIQPADQRKSRLLCSPI